MQNQLLRNLARIAKYLLIGAVILYAMDWAIFEVRMTRGAGMGSVVVDQFLQIPLKGNKLEYDYTGTANQSCSQSLLPQYSGAAWNTPCWWLARHRTQWNKVENRGTNSHTASAGWRYRSSPVSR